MDERARETDPAGRGSGGDVHLRAIVWLVSWLSSSIGNVLSSIQWVAVFAVLPFWAGWSIVRTGAGDRWHAVLGGLVTYAAFLALIAASAVVRGPQMGLLKILMMPLAMCCSTFTLVPCALAWLGGLAAHAEKRNG